MLTIKTYNTFVTDAVTFCRIDYFCALAYIQGKIVGINVCKLINFVLDCGIYLVHFSPCASQWRDFNRKPIMLPSILLDTVLGF